MCEAGDGNGGGSEEWKKVERAGGMLADWASVMDVWIDGADFYSISMSILTPTAIDGSNLTVL